MVKNNVIGHMAYILLLYFRIKACLLFNIRQFFYFYIFCSFVFTEVLRCSTRMKNYLFITLGVLSVAIGVAARFIPLVPTTPFILLAAYLFARSSPRMHQKLLDNKFTGAIIRNVNTGLSLRARLISISFMWLMICISAFGFFHGTMRYVAIGLGVIGTIAQLVFLRKRKPKESVVALDVESEDEKEKRA